MRKYVEFIKLPQIFYQIDYTDEQPLDYDYLQKCFDSFDGVVMIGGSRRKF